MPSFCKVEIVTTQVSFASISIFFFKFNHLSYHLVQFRLMLIKKNYVFDILVQYTGGGYILFYSHCKKLIL